MKAFLSAAEVAERYGVATRTVQQLARLGKIPGALQVGRQWRFKSSEIGKWETSSGDQGRPSGMPRLKIPQLREASDGRPLSDETRARLERLRGLSKSS